MFPLYLTISLVVSVWQRSTKPESFWHSLPKHREFDQPWDSVGFVVMNSWLALSISTLAMFLGGRKRSHFCRLIFYRLLQNNNINGLIPAEIGKLTKLKTLDLSSNHFSGEIPSSVGHLESLQYLWVQFCSTVLALNSWTSVPLYLPWMLFGRFSIHGLLFLRRHPVSIPFV